MKTNLDSKIESYDRLNSEYRNDINKYSNLDSLIKEARTYNDDAISSLQKIKEYGYSQTELADIVGKKQSTIANKLRLLKLDRSIRKILLENK